METVASDANLLPNEQAVSTRPDAASVGSPASETVAGHHLTDEPPVSATAAEPAFPPPAALPTQQAPHGIRIDFNDGCRIVLPEGEQPWRVRLSDLETGNVLYQTEIRAGRVNSAKRYFVPFRIEIWRAGESMFTHDYSSAGRDILINFPVGTLGDTIGWFPYAVKFKARHDCRLTCAMAEPLIPLFRDVYPDITFVAHKDVRPDLYYASYNMGLFFGDKDCVHQPCDFRHVGLHRTAGYILGVDPKEMPPHLTVAPGDARYPNPMCA